MDKEWLKVRLRMAGKTSSDLADAIQRDRAVVSRILNGHQKLSLDQAKIFAETLGVEVAEVLKRSGLVDQPSTAQVFNAGFAESDAAAWVPGPGLAEAQGVRLIADVLGARQGVDIWRVRSRAMALAGLLEGDFMLVDTHLSERVKAGDVVVAQIYNNAAGTAATVLRRFEPPVLVAASTDPADARVHVVDGNNVVVRGKIVASWRV